MEWTIKPVSKIQGKIAVPADKSITHRAIMFSAIAEGVSVVENYLSADDCMRTVAAFRNLGVRIEKTDKALTIHGAGLEGLMPHAGTIDAGNSGTTARLLAGLLSSQSFISRISGDESLSKRPMKRIIEPLERMGARIIAREGNFLPLEIYGTDCIKPISYASPVASAQVKSSIILAALKARGETSVEEPYQSRNHTELMLKARGVDLSVIGTKVTVRGPAKIKPMNMRVPADISSAAFFIVAGCLCKDSMIEIPDVGVNPTRDGIIEVLKKMGAKLKLSAIKDISGEPVASITAQSSRLRAFEIKGGMIPRLIDEIPVLVLAATQAEGTSVISGAEELRVKESDRLKTITAELAKMGAKIEEKKDGLIIHGPTKLKGAALESYGDHRIAMTLAVAGLIAEGETKIRNVECVETSFPGFDKLMKSVSPR